MRPLTDRKMETTNPSPIISRKHSKKNKGELFSTLIYWTLLLLMFFVIFWTAKNMFLITNEEFKAKKQVNETFHSLEPSHER